MSDMEPIVCRSFTFARRYPLVIGKLSGWTPWWGPATPAQYVIGVASAILLLVTRRFWAHLPGPMNLLVMIGVPFGLAWYVRSARIENRSPFRALLGLITLVGTPPKGVRNGKPVTEPRPVRLVGGAIFVSELRPPRRKD